MALSLTRSRAIAQERLNSHCFQYIFTEGVVRECDAAYKILPS